MDVDLHFLRINLYSLYIPWLCQAKRAGNQTLEAVYRLHCITPLESIPQNLFVNYFGSRAKIFALHSPL